MAFTLIMKPLAYLMLQVAYIIDWSCDCLESLCYSAILLVCSKSLLKNLVNQKLISVYCITVWLQGPISVAY